MEKSDDPKANQSDKANNRGPVWDCGSSLYDSFELESFNRRLDSAISARTLSMPHLCGRESSSRTFSMPPPPQYLRGYDVAPPPPPAKKVRKISRSLNKLLRSLFRMKPHAGNDAKLFRVPDRPREGFYVFCDKSGALSTFPEVPEINSGADHGVLSPELKPLVRRTVSDRFTATRVGVSCA